MSDIQKAKILTDEIFNNIKTEYFLIKKFESIWSLYDVVYLEILNGKAKLNDSLVVKIKEFLSDLFLIVYSILSILFFCRKKKVAIWSGDFFYKNCKGDFRLGQLLVQFEKNKINYIEFIRGSNLGFKEKLKNIYQRRRPAIYYDSFSRILNLFLLEPKFDLKLINENKNHIDILSRHFPKIPSIKEILMFRLIFKILKIQLFIPWEFSSRQSSLIYAAKTGNIKTLGFMHGLGFKDYMIHEFIEPFRGKNKIGPDIFFVWSEWWKKYYEKHTRIYNKIVVSGELRKYKNYHDLNISKIKKILFISEPLSRVQELYPYFKVLFPKFQIGIKTRINDKEHYVIKMLKLNSKIDIENESLDKLYRKYDLILGTHSTAVVESLKFGKPFLLLETKKWGNYFNVNSELFVKSDTELLSKINRISIKNYKNIKENFFGDLNQNGVSEIVKFINQLK